MRTASSPILILGLGAMAIIAPALPAAAAPALRGGVSLQNGLASEYRETDQRALVLDSAKAKGELEAEPFAGLRLGVAVLAKEYRGTTTILADGYLPDDARAGLVAGDPDAGRPGTADLLRFQLVREVRVHQAYADAGGERLRLKVGRQVFLAGDGQIFRPTDLFNYSRPGDPMWEPEGHDGARLTAKLASLTADGFVERGAHPNGTARISAARAGWRGGVAYTRHWQARTDWQALNTVDGLTALGAGSGTFARDFRWDLVAAELSGAVAQINLRAEAGYAFIHAPAGAGTLTRAGQDHLRLALGLDRTFASGLNLLAEYLYLGQGRLRARELDLNDRLALLTGEVLSASRHSLFFSVGQELGTHFTVGVRGAVAAMDAVNVVLFPVAGAHLSDHAVVELSATLPLGARRGVNGNSGPGALLWLKLETGALEKNR